MAKRNRYREMESLMTRVIIGDALVFALYLLCAGLGWTVLKVTSAIIAILGSLLCLGWLVSTDGNGLHRDRSVRAGVPASGLSRPCAYGVI